MNTLDKIYTEDQAVDLAEKVLSLTKDKIKEQIANKFYEETEGWLYELYDNNKAKIKKELIAEITEQYVTDPTKSAFNELRKKIWQENKDAILPSLTDEVLRANMEMVLMHHTSNDYHFQWRWKDAIVELVLSNWDKFKDDERIIQQFGREIDRLKSQVSSLQQKLNEASSALSAE